MQTKCENCKKDIEKKQPNRYKHHFCNLKCFNEFRIKNSQNKIIECEICEKKVNRCESQFKKYSHHFCSKKCFFIWYDKERDRFYEENGQKIIKLYNSGLTIKNVAKQIGKSKTAIRDWLSNQNLTKSKSLGKVQINLNDSNELWYVVGVSKGDGSVYDYPHHQCKNARFYHIWLGVKDKEFSNEFFRCCKNIGFNPRQGIKPSKTHKQGFSWIVNASSKVFNEWYKTVTYDQILNLKDEFKIAFLKGMFDSEGCFYRNKNKVSQISCKMTNTKIEIIRLIENILSSIGFDSNHYFRRGGFCDAYDINILGGKSEIKRFLQMIQPSIPRKQWSEPIEMNRNI